MRYARCIDTPRNVKGVLFADYVRMIRGRKDVDWTRHLRPEDLLHVGTKVEPNAWYPMETFERLGNAILAEIAHGALEAVRRFGRFSVDQLRAATPHLVSDGDPVETLMRFRVLRATFFDFEALQVPMLTDEQAEVVISYHMGAVAEEAASYQTMGFFERLLEVSGATSVFAQFAERSWAGDARTLLEVSWQQGPPVTSRGPVSSPRRRP
ncbi:MAG: hypothetical protein ABI175_00850 [Polyangiales bacterium]